MIEAREYPNSRHYDRMWGSFDSVAACFAGVNCAQDDARCLPERLRGVADAILIAEVVRLAP